MKSRLKILNILSLKWAEARCYRLSKQRHVNLLIKKTDGSHEMNTIISSGFEKNPCGATLIPVHVVCGCLTKTTIVYFSSLLTVQALY